MASRKTTDKLALITGSTSGIGLGIARKLASDGYGIILTGFADEELVTFLKNDFREKYNTDPLYVSCDLTSPVNIERMCKQIIEFAPSGVDILVNNAGTQYVYPIDELPPERWDEMVAVMLSAPFHLIRLLVPYMKKKGFGRIINTSSILGQVAAEDKACYSAVKHGLEGLCKGVALDMVGTGITCNCVSPGCTDTPLLMKEIRRLSEEQGISVEEAKLAFLMRQKQPVKELISVEDIAELVAYLCRDVAKSVTGSIWGIDNGWLAK